MDTYQQMVQAIIRKQISVLGAQIAIDRARKVSGLDVDESGAVKSLSGNGVEVLEKLVTVYQDLLGPAGLSFCRDAAGPIIKKNSGLQLPKVLQT